MNSFGPQSFTAGIKRLVRNHSKFKKEAIALISSIIYEINKDFVNACLQNNVTATDITLKHVRESIKNTIPREFRKYAFAAANNTVMNYNSGLIDYKCQNIQKEKEIGLDARLLRKCLEKIILVVNNGLSLSKDCTVLVRIIQKLATQMAESAVETIGDKTEMSLEDMRNVVSSFLGEEMFQHSEGHAESNLEWYRADYLDFTIKPLITEVQERSLDDKNIFWGKCVQKIFKSKYSKEVIQNFDNILNDLINRIFDETTFVFQHGIHNVSNDSISEEHVTQAAKTLLPEPLFEFALSNAESKLLNYRCGILKYDYVRKVEGEPTIEEKRVATSIVPDFRKGVKHIMNMMATSYSKGLLPFINDVLNDISSTIAERSSESARRNDNILSENDIIVSVNDLLPIQLRDHAILRIAHIQSKEDQLCIQLPGNISSSGIQPADVRTEGQIKQSSTGSLPHIPKSHSDETKKYSDISKQASSPQSVHSSSTVNEEDLENKSAHLERKTFSREIQEAISSIVSLTENDCASQYEDDDA